jgi:hypothetical protein
MDLTEMITDYGHIMVVWSCVFGLTKTCGVGSLRWWWGAGNEISGAKWTERP